MQIIFRLFINVYKKTVNENSHKILINTDEATFQIINYILSKFFMCITYYDRDTNILLIDKITYLEVKEKKCGKILLLGHGGVECFFKKN